MPLARMEHFLVLSDDIEQTRRFYCEALGMRVGLRPKLSFAGYWLYVDDVPCVHVAEWNGYRAYAEQVGIPMSTRGPGTGPVDHIAFNGLDYGGTRETLKRLGIAYSENRLDDIGLTQMFVADPNGLTIELNFRESAP